MFRCDKQAHAAAEASGGDALVVCAAAASPREEKTKAQLQAGEVEDSLNHIVLEIFSGSDNAGGRRAAGCRSPACRLGRYNPRAPAPPPFLPGAGSAPT